MSFRGLSHLSQQWRHFYLSSKHLIIDQILKHGNGGVKVSAVASLWDAPYNDNQMKVLIIELLNMLNHAIFFCFGC